MNPYKSNYADRANLWWKADQITFCSFGSTPNFLNDSTRILLGDII